MWWHLMRVSVCIVNSVGIAWTNCEPRLGLGNPWNGCPCNSCAVRGTEERRGDHSTRLQTHAPQQKQSLFDRVDDRFVALCRLARCRVLNPAPGPAKAPPSRAPRNAPLAGKSGGATAAWLRSRSRAAAETAPVSTIRAISLSEPGRSIDYLEKRKGHSRKTGIIARRQEVHIQNIASRLRCDPTARIDRRPDCDGAQRRRGGRCQRFLRLRPPR
jgi:hypothetical protein